MQLPRLSAVCRGARWKGSTMSPLAKSPNRLVITLACLTALTLIIVGTSFYFAYREVDGVTSERQAVTVRTAMLAQARGLERELRLETVWGDAFTNTSVTP